MVFGVTLAVLGQHYTKKENVEKFFNSSNKIRIAVAVIVVVPAMVYIFIASFCDIPPENQRTVDTVIGFLLGSIVTTIVSYYFGSSQGSADKNKQIEVKEGV